MRIGGWAYGPTAGQWELCELRGSCTVLREPRGETPLGHSPTSRPEVTVHLVLEEADVRDSGDRVSQVVADGLGSDDPADVLGRGRLSA